MSDGSLRSKRNPTDITTRDWARNGVVAYNNRRSRNFESLAQVNELWSRVLDEFLGDPRTTD
ncbi:MAG: hypothetical protein CMH39_09460 [Micrococcales bacterium]|nr:hypothetical protein [Micrococcales bacterium]